MAIVGPGQADRALGVAVLLLHARLELDRVVDPEAEQHRQHRDRGHRQRRADQRHRAERDRDGGERDGQRHDPQAAAEHEREHQRHHDQRHHEQPQHRARERVREVLEHHGRARDRVARLVELPLRHLHGAADLRDRVAPLGVGQRLLQAHLDHRRAAVREQVGEARLRRAGAAAGVEHERRDEVGVVDLRHAGQPQPVLEVDLQQLLEQPGVDDLLGRLGRLVLGGLRAALAARDLARRAAGPLRLRLGLLRAQRQLLLDLADGRVHERAGAVDDLHRLGARERGAGRPLAARRRRVGRLVARQAALEPDQRVEVLGQDEVGDVAAHQHDHGLLAEALAVALRGRVGVARAVHERVGGRARVERQRERGAHRRQRRHAGDDAGRPPGRGPDDPLECAGDVHDPGATAPCRPSRAGTASSRRRSCTAPASCTPAPGPCPPGRWRTRTC